MNKLIAGLAAALSIGLLATAAEAAPLGAAGNASGAAVSSEVIQVHGLHTSCQRDGKGWHRSYIWGRQGCMPAKRHGKKHMHKHKPGKHQHSGKHNHGKKH